MEGTNILEGIHEGDEYPRSGDPSQVIRDKER